MPVAASTGVASTMMILITQSLPALLTFAAACFAAWVTWAVTRSKARTDIITAGRQNWISALRDDLAELFQKRVELSEVSPVSGETPDPETKARHEKLLQQVRLLRARILLRMDETEKPFRNNPQIALSKTVRAFADVGGPYSEDLANDLIKHGQAVLDAAWGQVKILA